MKTEDLFNQAEKYYDKGNFIDAFNKFIQAAELGCGEAMCRIAVMYDNGEGTLRDIEKSLYWDMKAIDAGCDTSILNIGITYKRMGDLSKAVFWLEKAFEKFDGEAALELAKLYSENFNSPLEYEKYLNAAITSDNISEDSLEEAKKLIKLLHRRLLG